MRLDVCHRGSWLAATALVLAFAAGLVAQPRDGDRWQGTPQRRFQESEIVAKYQCTTCHTITDKGGTVGPILNQIANRRTEEWIRRWLRDPSAVKPGTKMPQFPLTPDEYEQAIGYLTTMKRDIDAESILARRDDPRLKGEALFEEYDCYACHRVGAQGRFIGPDLTWVGRRKTEDWERIWLKDPDAWKPGTFMPNFQLSAEAIGALTGYLESLRGQRNRESREWEFNVNFILNNRADRRGELVFRRLACWSCHGEEGRGGIRNPNAAPDENVPALEQAANKYTLEELNQLISARRSSEKLDANRERPPFSCPDYSGVLTDDEFKDLYAFLVRLAPKKRVFRFR